MKARKIIAGIIAAAVITTGAATPYHDICGMSVVSEAASRLKAPADLKATVKNNSVSLSWSAVNGADGYIVYKYNANKKIYPI